MRILYCAALATLLACAPYLRADDVADIRKSGRAFAEALNKNDIATAKKHAIVSEQEGQLLEALGAFQSSRENLTKAAVAKFGDEGKEIVPQRQPGRQPQINFDKNKFEDAQIQVNGDTAVVTSKDAEHREIARFKKEGGEWKVDFKDNPNMQRAAQSAPVLEKLSGVYSEIAGEIKEGKYSSVQQARQALAVRMASVFRGGRPQR